MDELFLGVLAAARSDNPPREATSALGPQSDAPDGLETLPTPAGGTAVRVQLLGWGQETPEAVTDELVRWLRKGQGPEPVGPGSGKTAGDGAPQPLRRP